MKLIELLNVIPNKNFRLCCRINGTNLTSCVTKRECNEWLENEVDSITSYDDQLIIGVKIK